jgi:hypothetical protein
MCSLEALKLVVLKDYKWMIGGDFNMVEKVKDKILKCGRMISNHDIMAWEGFKPLLQVEEPKRSMGSLFYSWDNRRMYYG